MTIEVWSVVLSAATFIVIAVTAVAATIQLRHLRASNQLTALVTLLEDWQKPEMQAWVQFVRGGALAEKLADPAYLRDLATTRSDRSLHPWLHICDYYEQLGSYLKYGLIDKTFLDVSCVTVSTLYERLLPCIERLREIVGNNTLFENFEYLAVQARLWIRAHPNGVYPRGVPHYDEIKR
ncbi:MAG: hypothetical protein JOZ97_01450 [Candidatus Eremiobacteraeota bacterium]|nr:hypothetical protein [Candidatus Eremiobacteraeota bacterium]